MKIEKKIRPDFSSILKCSACKLLWLALTGRIIFDSTRTFYLWVKVVNIIVTSALLKAQFGRAPIEMIVMLFCI